MSGPVRYNGTMVEQWAWIRELGVQALWLQTFPVFVHGTVIFHRRSLDAF